MELCTNSFRGHWEASMDRGVMSPHSGIGGELEALYDFIYDVEYYRSQCLKLNLLHPVSDQLGTGIEWEVWVYLARFKRFKLELKRNIPWTWNFEEKHGRWEGSQLRECLQWVTYHQIKWKSWLVLLVSLQHCFSKQMSKNSVARTWIQSIRTWM